MSGSKRAGWGYACLLTVLFGCLAWVSYDATAQFCGWRVEVGDAVIATDATAQLPATVIGFGERGVHVRSEEPSTAGMTLWFHFDQCRVVHRSDAGWRELGGLPESEAVVLSRQPMASASQ